MQPLDVLAHGHPDAEAHLPEELRTAELFENQAEEVPQASEPFGNETPPASEPFRSAEPALPNPSEDLRSATGSLPKLSEEFGSEIEHLPKVAAEPDVASERFGNRSLMPRRADHTLTIKEVVKQFEAAGVARTERSVVNWCQSNKDGVARLDAYFDPNERRYFIAPSSVAHAIEEEKQKLARAQSPSPSVAETRTPVSATFRNDPMTKRRTSEPFGNEASNASEAFRNEPEQERASSEPFRNESVANRRSFGRVPQDAEAMGKRLEEMEGEMRDLRFMNKFKDKVIEQLNEARERDARRLNLFSRKIGEMASRLLQLGAPREEVELSSSLDGTPESMEHR